MTETVDQAQAQPPRALTGIIEDATSLCLPRLGGRRVRDFGEVIGFGVPPRPEFWIGPWTTGEGFRETHIAFVAPDRAAVQAFFPGGGQP